MDFFHCMVVVSTLCKHHIKVNLASDNPFKTALQGDWMDHWLSLQCQITCSHMSPSGVIEKL